MKKSLWAITKWSAFAVFLVLVYLLLRLVQEREFKYITRYSTGSQTYVCSKAIRVEPKNFLNIIKGQANKIYVPQNQTESDLFCHPTN